jgi:hypothetical protein
MSPTDLQKLNMEGQSWRALKVEARKPAEAPNLSDKDQKGDTHVLAKALVYARCSLEPAHAQCRDVPLDHTRQEIIQQIHNAMGTEHGGLTLALGRELVSYVIAADLVGLPPERAEVFRRWLSEVRHKRLQGQTLISTHENRPNNWGTMAGASRIAAALYLDDTVDLDRAARVFQGWLGDRTAYAGFAYRDLSWQCDPTKPVGINPKGCTKSRHSLDGVLPDDQRRGGSFRWPPPRENYVYEALQGAIVQAVMLHRAGYDVFQWSDQALLRAYRWLYHVANFPAVGDDLWQLPLIDYYYDTHFWDGRETRPGKNMGWTGWTHGQRGGGLQAKRGMQGSLR